MSVPEDLGTSTKATQTGPMPTASSSTLPDPDSTPKSSTLSIGAVAGIATGSVIGGLLIIYGLLLIVWIYSRKKRDVGKTDKRPLEVMVTEAGELHSTQRFELASEISELSSGVPRLPSDKEAATKLHELP